MTPYYDHAGITIYHGDCREILPTLGKFDLLLTDPPYGTGGKPYHGGGRHRRSGARQLTGRAVEGDAQPYEPAPDIALAPAAVLWGAHNYASRLPDSPLWLAWDKKCGKAADGIMGDVDLAWVRGHRFKAVRVFRHMWAGVLRASEVGHGSLHPTQKPVALMSWCLSFFPEARTVVDPYMGSGPVAKACADAGLRYVGVELVEAYCEVAANRLAQEVMFG
jgi:site-specific DNA-methyltransferase (adenine-specific)